MGGLPAALQSSFGTLHCELAVGHVQFVGFGIQDTRRSETIARSLICEGVPSPLSPKLAPHPGSGGKPQRVSPTPDLDIECVATAIWRPRSARMPNTRSASHLSDSGTLLVLAARVFLVAVRCSVMTTTSDDMFSIPTITPGWNLGSHFPSLAGLAGVYKIFYPNSMIGVLSLRPCSLWSGVIPSLPIAHLFIRYAASSTSQQGILFSDGTLMPVRFARATFNGLAWQGTKPTVLSVMPLDWLSATGGLSGTV